MENRKAMTARVRTPGLAILTLALPVLAHAGAATSRKGFWWGFGLGYGSARARCERCTSPSREGDDQGRDLDAHYGGWRHDMVALNLVLTFH
jgi:hypothetical protein